MIKRALVVLAIAGIYIWSARKPRQATGAAAAHDAESRWASEGGANVPPGV